MNIEKTKKSLIAFAQKANVDISFENNAVSVSSKDGQYCEGNFDPNEEIRIQEAFDSIKYISKRYA